LLVQLRNGARIGEAIEAVKEFCESKGRAVSVRVRIEKRKEGDTRLMVLPEELRSSEGRELLAKACLRLSRVKAPRVDIADYAKRPLALTRTPEVRVRYVSAQEGVSPLIMAKITDHRSLDHILHYTEVRLVEEVLAGLRGP